MLSTSVSSPATRRPSASIAPRRIWFTGLLATAAAAAANAALFFVVVNGFGVSDAALDRVAPTLVLSALGGLGGTFVFAVIARYARQPIRTFRLVSLAVLMVSFIPDFFAAGATTPAGVPTLLLMHVIAAAIIVGLLTAQTRN